MGGPAFRRLSRAEAAELRDGHPHASDLDLKIRYGSDVRKRFVELAKEGHGRKFIAHELDLSVYTVRDWQRMYASLGEDAFIDLTPQRVRYDYMTKVEAVHAVTSGCMTRAEAMRAFKIAHPATLARWIRLWRAGGDEGLIEKKRGRPKLLP